MASIIRRANGIYYVVATRRGRRVWRSTGSVDKQQALEIARTEFADLVQPQQRFTLSSFAEQFFPYAETNLAPGTVQLYRAAIRVFFRLLGDRGLKSYTVRDIERFKSLRVKEVSPVKVNIDFRCLKALFQTAVKWNLLGTNPFAGVKQLKIPPQRPLFFTKDDFRQLIAAIPHPWFKELVIFAVSTMMRAGEIVNLTWHSVDLKHRVILVENTKEFKVKTTQPLLGSRDGRIRRWEAAF